MLFKVYLRLVVDFAKEDFFFFLIPAQNEGKII